MELILEQIAKLNSLYRSDIEEFYDEYGGCETNLRNTLFLLKQVTFKQSCNYSFAFKNNETCVSLHDVNFDGDSFEQVKTLWDTINENESKYNSALKAFEEYLQKLVS